uniref:Uncharacterized protein n=1 Tax=Anguilla anguilla TaxID=7936 RepID=A0A0E9XKL0_ANGAN
MPKCKGSPGFPRKCSLEIKQIFIIYMNFILFSYTYCPLNNLTCKPKHRCDV